MDAKTILKANASTSRLQAASIYGAGHKLERVTVYVEDIKNLLAVADTVNQTQERLAELEKDNQRMREDIAAIYRADQGG